MSGTASQLDTIDGTNPEPQTAVPSPSTKPAFADYTELVTVERRHYQIDHQIAQGGMGRVLAARDLRLGRSVAIKELLPRNRDLAARFEREARITAKLQHPAIIHVYEAGVWDGGEPFYAMTRVVGRSLDRVVNDHPTLAERLALVPHVIAVAEALAYAHSHRVIHRDLKPANVLIGEYGETVVIDWGLAKDLGVPFDPQESLAMRAVAHPLDTTAGAIVGTPAYMPPEQACGESVDERADVYALGALLYHVLTGAPPFTGASSRATLEAVKAGPCARVNSREPGAPSDLVAIVDKAMARDRADRYANAGELAKDLSRFQTGQLVAARKYTTAQLFRRWAALAIVGLVSIRRIFEEQAKDQRRRRTLLEERARVDLLSGQAGRALAYLMDDPDPGPAERFMIADALRSFEPEIARFTTFGPPHAIAASRDGSRVATIDRDGAIAVWSTERRRLATLPARAVERLLFGPDDRAVIALGSDGRIVVYGDNQPPFELGHHDGAIRDAAISSEGRWLATASADGTARAWDLVTHKPGTRAPCHDPTSEVTAVRFAPHGDDVVSVGDDQVVCRWHPVDGSHVPIRGHKGRIAAARWASGLIATASADGEARLWDSDGKTVTAPLRHDGGGALTAIDPAPDGSGLVTAGTDHVAWLWDFDVSRATVRPRWKLVGHHDAVTDAIYAPDGLRLATASRDGTVKLWDVASGFALASFEHGLAVHTVQFVGQRLFTGSDDHTARLWDAGDHSSGRVFELDATIHAIAAHRDTVIVGTSDHLIRIYDNTHRTAPIVVRDAIDSVYAVAIAPDGSVAVTGGEDRDALVIDTHTGARRATLGPHEAAIHAITIERDGATAVTGDDNGVLRWWAIGPRRLIASRQLPGGIRELATAPSGDVMIVVDSEGRAYEFADRAPQRVVASDVTAVAFRGDGSQLALATSAGIGLYAVDHGRVAAAASVLFDTPTGEVRALSYAADGALVITAGSDGVARLWDAAKGKLLGSRGGASVALNAIAMAGDVLWAGGDSQTMRGWDVALDHRSLAELRSVVAARVPWTLDEDDVVRPKRGE